MRLITKENYERLKDAYERIMSFYNAACECNGEDAWADAYCAIFGGDYCRIVRECVLNFNWYDSDASYQDDVCAFVHALEELMSNIKIIETN